MSGAIVSRWYPDAAAAARDGAALIAEAIASAAAQGHEEALLILPGGRSPRPILDLMKDRPLPWNRVLICPTDDRCVAAGSALRNDHMLRESLTASPAEAARVVALADAAGHPVGTLPPLPFPAAASVVGMGADGHVASLFPGQPFTVDNQPHLVEGLAPAEPRRRVSLSASALIATRHLILLVSDAEKAAVLDAALEVADPSDMLPVARLLTAAQTAGVAAITILGVDSARS